MELFSIKLPLIKERAPLLDIMIKNIKKSGNSLKEGDIIVIAEKVIATSQGRVVKLSEVKQISEKAKNLAPIFLIILSVMINIVLILRR